MDDKFIIQVFIVCQCNLATEV